MNIFQAFREARFRNARLSGGTNFGFAWILEGYYKNIVKNCKLRWGIMYANNVSATIMITPIPRSLWYLLK